MKTLVPSFYHKFLCKADACQHSCCKAGWEIDVDEDSAAYYQSVKGKLGADLRANLKETNEGYQLRLNPDGTCPFLEQNGLCHLITTLGEDSLCYICAEHPRFYEFFPLPQEDIELGGVGLCCEATCELLLTKEPLTFSLEGDARVLSFSHVLEAIGIAIPKEKLHYTPNCEGAYVDYLVGCLKQTEPLDAAWTAHIKALEEKLPQLKLAMAEGAASYERAIFTKIYLYILYRQLEKAAHLSTETLLKFAQLNTDFVFLDSLFTSDLAESLRRWSEQIEYDDENITFLLLQ